MLTACKQHLSCCYLAEKMQVRVFAGISLIKAKKKMIDYKNNSM